MTEYAMPSITGYLWKTDPNAKHWRRRYFVLTGNKLGYRKKASSSVFLKEPVDLSLATIYETPDNALPINQKTKYGFRVIMDDGSRTYNLCAVSAEERNDWCYHLADVCNPAAEEDSKPPPPPSPDESENGELDEDNEPTEYAANERQLDSPRSSDINNRLSNAVNDTQVEDRGYTNTVVQSATSGRDAQEEEEDDTLNFFLVLLGSDRKFQVAMPEMEAEELTIREIKENFAGTLQAQVEDIVISIGGEVLRSDIKGHEFGLADGTELEVTISKQEEMKISIFYHIYKLDFLLK